MCLVDIEKAFHRVPRKVMKWTMRKKGLPQLIAIAVISFCHEARTKLRVGLELFKDFLVLVVIRQGSVLLPLLFAIPVDVTEYKRRIDE